MGRQDSDSSTAEGCSTSSPLEGRCGICSDRARKTPLWRGSGGCSEPRGGSTDLRRGEGAQDTATHGLHCRAQTQPRVCISERIHRPLCASLSGGPQH